MWRYGVAGDLPGEGEAIDGDALGRLVAANGRRPVLAYTHKPPGAGENLAHLRAAIANGFTINASADTLAEADRFADLGLPVVTVLPADYARRRGETIGAWRARTRGLPTHTPGGRRIAVCPATYTATTCARCQVCCRPDRPAIVGFPAHGTQRRKVTEMTLPWRQTLRSSSGCTGSSRR